jgi:uncharacterized membrane protein YphA (DoxX/SURF4 family)
LEDRQSPEGGVDVKAMKDGAYWALRITYGVVPIVAGLDKFTNLLADWSKYLSPVARDVLPFSATTFMWIVGVIEVLAGVLVLSRYTRVGASVVGAWLLGVAVNLVLAGHHDIAVRDVVMAVGAFSLAQLHATRRVTLVTPTTVVPTRVTRRVYVRT